MHVHIPVMADEVVEHLRPKPGDLIVDCTVGSGGHALRILEKITPSGKLIAIDQDEEAINIAEQYLKPYSGYFNLIRGDFRELDAILKNIGIEKVDGLFFDLGVASMHFDTPSRGFSLKHDGPLDMRMDRRRRLTARTIVNAFSYTELEKILREYGEERKSRQIARSIVEMRKKRPIETTFELSNIVENVYYRKRYSRRIHPATKTFLALRIAVNDELEALRLGLISGLKHLKSGSRAVVISFHSLEDRIVKHTFKEFHRKEELNIITKFPLRPRFCEVKENPRARSAKLRTGERI